MNIQKKIALILVLILSMLMFCTQTAPLVGVGEGDLKFVDSASMLDANKTAKEIGITDSIIINFVANIKSYSVVMEKGSVGGTAEEITVSSSGKVLTITPKGGAWTDTSYNIKVSAELSNGVSPIFSVLVSVSGPGFGDIRLINSASVLDNNLESKTIGLTDTITLNFYKDITSATVVMEQGGVGGDAEQITTSTSGKVLTIIPKGGAWRDTTYNIKISAILSDTATAVFSILSPVSGVNFGDIRLIKSSSLLDNNLQVTTLGQADSINFIIYNNIKTANVIITNAEKVVSNIKTTITDSLLTIKSTSGVWKDANYSIVLSLITEDNSTINITLNVLKSSTVQTIATNAEAVEANLGEITKLTSLRDTLWVKFSQNIKSVVWDTTGPFTHTLMGGGEANKINADTWTSSDTLFVVPNNNLKAVTNGSSVGFSVTVTSTSSQTVHEQVKAYFDISEVHVVSSNIQNGELFRPFKVIGDSLVITFSTSIDTSISAAIPFKVSGFAQNYTVTWNSGLTTATIKNIDTLAAAEFGSDFPYHGNDANNPTWGDGTRAYGAVTFLLTTSDGEEHSIIPKDPIEIHTEFGLAVVGSNILHKHKNELIPVVASEEVMDTMPASSNITITFNRAVDTALFFAAKLDNNIFVSLREASDMTVPIPIAISFSSDLKTMTINPEEDLIKLKKYYIRLNSVPGLGITGAGAIVTHGGDEKGLNTVGGVTNILSDDALMVFYTAIDISNLSLVIEHNLANGMASPTSNYNVNLENSISLQINEVAWNKFHIDSVEQYEARVKTVSRNGDESGWFFVLNTENPNGYDTSVFAVGNDSTNTYTIDLTAENFITNIRTNGGPTGYSNGADVFNDSTTLQVQVRALNDDNEDGDYDDDGERGPWSNTLSYVDAIAPCDETYVSNYDNSNSGGVTVTSPWVNIDREFSGATTKTFTLTFPEDMDITSGVPAISIYYETDLGANAPFTSTPASSGWISARTFTFDVNIPGGVDYSDTLDPYYAISVAGLKDYYGNSIVSHGSVGSAADGVNIWSAGGTSGSINIEGLTSF